MDVPLTSLIWKCSDTEDGCGMTIETRDWSYQKMAQDGTPVCDCGDDMVLVPKDDGNKTLKVDDVTVTLGGRDPENPALGYVLGASSISSPWERDVCQHCKRADCFYDCEGSVNKAFEPKSEALDRSGDGVMSRWYYNGCLDGIESMILACAVAGIDVESSSFVEAVRTAKDAADNNT